MAPTTIGIWATIILFALLVPIQFGIVLILFRYAIPAIFKSGWQQLRTPAAKRFFVVGMIVVTAIEVAMVVWLG